MSRGGPAAAERSSGDGLDSAGAAHGVPEDPEDFDLPLPELPPLPADPRWRVEHLLKTPTVGR